MTNHIIKPSDALGALFRLEGLARQHISERSAEHCVEVALVAAYGPEKALDRLEALHAGELQRLHQVRDELQRIRHELSHVLPGELLS